MHKFEIPKSIDETIDFCNKKSFKIADFYGSYTFDYHQISSYFYYLNKSKNFKYQDLFFSKNILNFKINNNLFIIIFFYLYRKNKLCI